MSRIERRRALAAVAGVAGIAGCVATDDGSTATDTPDETDDGPRVGGVDLPVGTEQLRRVHPRDAIPAITQPAFGVDWTDYDAVPPEHRPSDPPSLPDDAVVIGVERDGRARAYPLRVLDRHEVVNDRFGGPLLVTYCPLCGSAVVAERVVDGTPTQFGVSGRLWRDDLVLYDAATESLWSQLLGAAIRGPATGTRLSLVPSTLTTMAEWRASHPDTQTLLPPPASAHVDGRSQAGDYAADPDGYDDASQLVGPDDSAARDGPLHAYELVIGVRADGVARAYPFDAVRSADVVNDTVGDTPVVVTHTPGGSLVAYDRTVDGTPREFTADGPRFLRAAGSRWLRTAGRAVDGPHADTTLASASDRSPMFWRAWRDFFPDTDVYDP